MFSWCQYKGCTNNSKTSSDKCFYPFPNQFFLRRMWVINSECDTRILNRIQLRHYLCSDHFPEHHMSGKILAKGALPLPRCGGDDTWKIDYDHTPYVADGSLRARIDAAPALPAVAANLNTGRKYNKNTCSNCVKVATTLKNLVLKRHTVNKKLVRQRNKNRREDGSTAKTNRLKLAQMQMRIDREWTDDEKEFALTIYGASAACYNAMRDILKISLPEPSLLDDFLKRIPG